MATIVTILIIGNFSCYKMPNNIVLQRPICLFDEYCSDMLDIKYIQRAERRRTRAPRKPEEVRELLSVGPHCAADAGRHVSIAVSFLAVVQ